MFVIFMFEYEIEIIFVLNFNIFLFPNFKNK